LGGSRPRTFPFGVAGGDLTGRARASAGRPNSVLSGCCQAFAA